jgi:hypothetical protein
MRSLVFLLALLGIAAMTAGCEEKKTTAPSTTNTETKGTTKKDW